MREKIKRNRKGSITVEAAMVLPLFILAILFIMNFLNVGYMQLTVQQGLNNAGQTFAQYCYVVDMMVGIDTINNKEIENKTNEVAEAVDTFIGSARNVGKVFSNFSLDSLPQLIDGAKNMAESAKGVKSALAGTGTVIKENFVGFLLTGGVEGGSTFIVKSQVEEYLDAMKVNRNLLDGEISYHVSMAKDDDANGLGANDIILRAVYRYKPGMFSMFMDEGLCMQQVVVVRPWIGGSTEGVRQFFNTGE